MPPTSTKTRLLFPLLLAVLCLVAARSGAAQAPTFPPLRIPIGGGYNPLTFAGMVQALVARAQNGQVKILILPVAYASSPTQVSANDRAEYLKTAELRRVQMEETCRRSLPAASYRCSALVAPVLVRPDALSPTALDYFTPDLTGILILGGDPAVAMQVIGGTPVEQAMFDAYQRGVVVAGTSAGNGMQSYALLAGYRPGYDSGNSLQFGAVEVWNSPEQRGLGFGLRGAILDEHFFERGRVARLLNAISLPGAPHVGLGVDSDTGLYLSADETVEKVFGLYTAAVLDAETYHAAQAVQYRGEQHWISLRNVLLHILAPGEFTYDLRARQHSLVVPPPRIERRYSGVSLPEGAGLLLLTSQLNPANPTEADLAASQTLAQRFVNGCGGANARLLIVAAGFPDQAAALEAANRFKARLGVSAQILALGEAAASPIQITPDITGLVLIGQDPARVTPDGLLALAEAWKGGLPLLADGAGAAVIGVNYAASGAPPLDDTGVPSPDALRKLTQGALLVGSVDVRPGLGLVELNLVPQVDGDNRWGQWIGLAYAAPSHLSIGLPDGAGLEISRDGASVQGQDGVYVLDLSLATLSQGQPQVGSDLNQLRAGMVIANGLLDVFAPGDLLAPSPADIRFAPLSAPTPGLAGAPIQPAVPAISMAASTPAATAPTLPPPPTATRIPRSPATRTPRPSPTPLPAPEAASTAPYLLNLMIGFGVLVTVVILAGVWANRRWIRLF